MIRFDHVSKTYPGGTRAVEDFSLTVERGSTTVFLGTSGCGKTTLMRMVNAMVTPTSGTVFVRGRDVAGENPVHLRRSIGYVLQEGGLFPHRTVADNVATVPRLEGTPAREARERARELLDLVGLEPDLARRYPAQLSGGQRQRVGVARALANRADILLMDEPFGALDPLVRADLQRELKEIQAALGTTILFVTHDVDEAFTLGDQVAVLSRGGRIEQVGAPSDLLSSPASEFVADFVGASRAARPVRLAGSGNLLIDEEGTPVGTLTPGSGGEGTAS
ncbi:MULTISPECIES: ABC transporter ATP-binding protein [Actinomycetes]|uniref:ABC transporter ATP-binding protein n=1 Tax=Actinomycetes TaxID=1760 RepID=UPI00066051C6|nr:MULTISPECIES: ATP-binding cassette domain-containing protein [Actinomycetes]MCM3900024.1 ATP-binding cassette domain-containing protein [Schaalia meyeri]